MLRLDAHSLMRLKCVALRRGVWFRSLSVLDREIVDLTIRVVDKPRSPKLIEALARIVVKIKVALMSPITRLMETVGKPLAKKISLIALKWGNRAAHKWAEDERFIRYLTIVDMNNIPGFRLSDALSAG